MECNNERGFTNEVRRCVIVVVALLLATCGDSGAGPPPPEPPANYPPEARGSIPDQALKLSGSAATVDVADNFADPDGDALSYAVSSSDDRVATASVSGSVVTVRPVGLGTATARVTARDPGGLTAGLSFRVTVTGRPDLVVGLSPDSAAVAPGDSFEHSVAVRNLGDGVSAATQSRTFASSDSVITTSDEEVGEASDVPGLGPGLSASRAATFTVSESASAGTVLWVGECVDAVEDESDTDNNCSPAVKVKVTGRPDLVVGVSPNNAAVAPGSSFEYTVEIRNRGDAWAPATTVGAFLSADSVVTTSDDPVGQVARVPALGSGEAVQGTAAMIVSQSASAGTVVWVGECVGAVEGESDTRNNCSSAIKVTVRAAGGLRAATPAVAQRPGGSGSGALPVLVVVGPASRIKFQPVVRSSQPSATSVCQDSSWLDAAASPRPTLCRSSGEFALIGSGWSR